MALSYIFFVPVANASVTNASGTKTYTANAAGIITGVTPPDAFAGLQATAAGVLPKLIAATGNTADRPTAPPGAGLTWAPSNFAPITVTGLPFYDATLSNTAYFVGTQFSSTGWVDRTGAAI